MKTTCCTALAAASLVSPAAFAQTATSNTVGYVTESLAVGFNLIGLSLHDQTVASGTFESESMSPVTLDAGTADERIVYGITDVDIDFATIDPGAAATLLLEIESGAQTGAVAEVDSVDGDTIYLSESLGAGAAEYNVRKAATLDDIFGTSLQGGATSGTADIIWLPDGSNSYSQFFYSTVGSEFRDVTAPFVAASAPVSVFYPDAIFVQVKGSSKDVVFAGEVKTVDTVFNAENGFNLVAVAGPVGQTLSNSSLSEVLTASSTSGNADIVWVPDGAGAYTEYFYSSVSNQWKLTSSPFGSSQDEVSLPSAIFIQRKGTSTAGVMTLPTTYQAL